MITSTPLQQGDGDLAGKIQDILWYYTGPQIHMKLYHQA